MNRQDHFSAWIATRSPIALRPPWYRWAIASVLLLPSAQLFAQQAREEPPSIGKNLSTRSRIQLGEVNPAVISIQESNPTSAAELLVAIDKLIAFQELELAKNYAGQLVRLNLAPGAMADVGEQVGGEILFRIITDTRLDRKTRELCNQIQSAVKSRMTNEGRLTRLATNAVSDDKSTRRQAVIDLRAVGALSVSPLVAILANPDRSESYDRVITALQTVGNPAIAPLLSMLESENEALKANVLLVLARLQSHEARYDLMAAAVAPDISPRRRRSGQLGADAVIGHVPSTEKVKKLLYRSVHDYLSGTRRLPTALDGTTTLWLWDDSLQKLISVPADEPTAAAGNASRLAHALWEVDPADERLARMKAIARLQRDKLAGGLDQPINPASAKLILTYAPKGEGRDAVDFMEEILELSLSRGYVPAATAAAEILGLLSVQKGGHADLIQRRAPQPHPLVRAAGHPDRRLRLVATRALLQLDPYEVYAGASAVPAALKYFANVTGKPRALVGDSRPQRRYLMTSLLNENGHEADAFRTSTDTFLAASRRPEYVVALISYTIGPLGIEDLMHEIRSDPRTADLPIGIIADPKSMLRAEDLAASDPLTTAFVVPRDATTMQLRIDQLVSMAGSRFVPHEIRMQHAAHAMRMIATISGKSGEMYDLNGFENVLEGGLYFSELAEPAARALGNLGSATAQRALIDAASQPRMPMPSRSAAVEAFTESVKRRGIGLTVQQIQRQANRYDQGAETSAENEALLWSILEAIQNAQE